MNIECHIVAWNEAETIHFTIKHYQRFCNRIVLWDNHSSDNTREIAKSMGCVVKTFGAPGELSDRAYMDLKNSCWKKNHPGQDHRDWVIVVDADEILSGYPQERTEATIYKTIGWNVFTHEMPEYDWTELNHGHQEDNYSKTVLFDPKAITDINFHIGSHVSKPKGNVVWGETAIILLHYRNVGGPQRLIDRHKLYRDRLSRENKDRKWGFHYSVSDEERVKEWEEKYQRSQPLGIFLQVGS